MRRNFLVLFHLLVPVFEVVAHSVSGTESLSQSMPLTAEIRASSLF